MDINNKIIYWVDLASFDIQTAEALFEKKIFIYSGYFCHLAIEKMLKAHYWYALNSEPPFTHNLVRLADLTGILNTLSQEQKNLLGTLTPLNIEARYPNDKSIIRKQLTESVTLDILTKTMELQKWILQLLS